MDTRMGKRLFVCLLVERELAAAVETVGADLTLRQSYGIDELFDGVELQCGESQVFGYGIHHAVVFRRTGGGVFVEVLVGVALKLLDHAARDKLHIALG